MDELEKLVKKYKKEKKQSKKDKILKQIFVFYKPLIKKICKTYNYIEEEEVITQHIYLAIVLAIREYNFTNNVHGYIKTMINRELHYYIIRPKFASKRKLYCSNIDNSYEWLKSSIKEDDLILKVDIENAINKLCIKRKIIFYLWLWGYSIKEIRDYLYNFSYAYNYSNDNIYFHLSQSKRIISSYLKIYQLEYV